MSAKGKVSIAILLVLVVTQVAAAAGARNDVHFVTESLNLCGSHGGSKVYLKNIGKRTVIATVKVSWSEMNRTYSSVDEYRLLAGESRWIGCTSSCGARQVSCHHTITAARYD